MGKSTISRKATFTVKGTGKNRVFTAINKRAHTVVRKAGKREHITYEALKALEGTGTYKYFHYTDDGSLKAIKF